MQRREFIAALGAAGIAGTAGCGAVSGDVVLSEPSVGEDSPGRKYLEWSDEGESVASFGVTGGVASGIVDLFQTELSHRDGTEVTRIELRVWMPDADAAADVAVVSPVEGDSSSPPSLALYTPDDATGTVIEVTDLDDLADETIDTLEFIIKPIDETATELAIDVTIELAEGGVLGDDYTLNGDLELAFPELAGG
ncbi:MAG: hypothetical protein ABEH88_05310 [Halobacteriales archaeon]